MTPETCRICLAKEPRRSLESHASTKQLASTPRRSPLPYQRAVTAARARARAHTLGSAPGAARRAPGCCSRAGVRAPAPRTAGCSARPRGRRRRPPGTRPPPAARACAPPGLRARRHFISSQPGSGCTASPCARRRALSVCHSTSQAYRRFNRAPPLLSTQSASARRHRRGARPEKRDYRTEECGSDVEASQRCWLQSLSLRCRMHWAVTRRVCSLSQCRHQVQPCVLLATPQLVHGPDGHARSPGTERAPWPSERAP
jgi:hypothetical protein